MKLFAATMISAVSAAKINLATMVMDPEDPSYSGKTGALLAALGIDVDTDPYFAEENPDVSNLRNSRGEIDFRNLKQLKILVASQMSQELKDKAGITGTGFGLYCYYGCHCLTDDEHVNEEYGLVGGKAIDDIDATCYQMGTCYKCLENKYKNEETGSTDCKPETTRYRFGFNEDGTIDCSDNKDQCKMDLCLCDKDFAETVAKYEMQWTAENHIVRGGFDRINTCKRAPKGISGKFETCCNADSFPNVGVKKTTHNACCGPYGYNSNEQTCCDRYDGSYEVLSGFQEC